MCQASTGGGNTSCSDTAGLEVHGHKPQARIGTHTGPESIMATKRQCNTAERVGFQADVNLNRSSDMY